MLSGLKQTYDPRHYTRIENEIKTHSGSSSVIIVETRTLEYLLDILNINRVHYLSIDVEGGEQDSIKSINFNKVFIDVIEFENNYTDKTLPIIDYLSSIGYLFLDTKGILNPIEIIMIYKDSEFLSSEFLYKL